MRWAEYRRQTEYDLWGRRVRLMETLQNSRHTFPKGLVLVIFRKYGGFGLEDRPMRSLLFLRSDHKDLSSASDRGGTGGRRRTACSTARGKGIGMMTLVEPGRLLNIPDVPVVALLGDRGSGKSLVAFSIAKTFGALGKIVASDVGSSFSDPSGPSVLYNLLTHEPAWLPPKREPSEGKAHGEEQPADAVLVIDTPDLFGLPAGISMEDAEPITDSQLEALFRRLRNHGVAVVLTAQSVFDLRQPFLPEIDILGQCSAVDPGKTVQVDWWEAGHRHDPDRRQRLL